jgi:hypothetical protein
MRGWKISPLGRAVIAICLSGLAVGLLAPRPWNAVGLFIAVAVFLAAIMDGLLGGRAGAPIPMTEDEQRSVIRRLYRPRSRGMSDDSSGR